MQRADLIPASVSSLCCEITASRLPISSHHIPPCSESASPVGAAFLMWILERLISGAMQTDSAVREAVNHVVAQHAQTAMETLVPLKRALTVCNSKTFGCEIHFLSACGIPLNSHCITHPLLTLLFPLWPCLCKVQIDFFFQLALRREHTSTKAQQCLLVRTHRYQP